MLRTFRATQIAVAMSLVFCLSTGTARADTWDLQLGRLCQMYVANLTTPLDCGGGYNPSTHGDIKKVIADNPAFRSLMSEVGAIFAPNILAPSDTQGFGGFSMNVEFGFTSVNTKKNSSDFTYTNPVQNNPDGSPKEMTMKGTRFWRAAESVNAKAFATGDIRNNQDNAELMDESLPSSFATTVTVMARKGFWFPLPSFEIGLGFRHLLGSRMFEPVGQVKLALHEGFQGFPIPAIAARASGGRVMGSPEFNLTVVGLDFSMSKHFGIGSTFNLTPYVGYQLLWFIADAEVVDATPGVDAVSEMTKDPNLAGKPTEWVQCRDVDCNGSFSFDDQSNINRHRIFGGFKINFYIATLLLEYTAILKGSTTDDIVQAQNVGGQLQFVKGKVADSSGLQHTINFSVGFDY